MKLAFFGAARQVTGSCYFVEANGLRILVDCGLHQERPYLERNWLPLPVPPEDIDFILLTHAHLDHSGLIPTVVRDGFAGTILTTAATADLLIIALMDAAKIQEEDAAYKKKRHQKEGRSGLPTEVPLYTTEDVQMTMPLVEEAAYDEVRQLGRSISVRFRDAGHILGSAMIELSVGSAEGVRTIVFSGDIGQWGSPFVRDPSLFERADYIVMESTYGDRDHEDPGRVDDLLGGIIRDTAKAGGNVVIPTFAIERAQDLMFHLSRLVRDKAIPPMPIYLDSPMAREVTAAFERHDGFLDEEARKLFASEAHPFRFPGLVIVRTPAESKAINSLRVPAVIMAGSGMCTGGRIKHHLAHNISRPESTILFVGYQARETLGRQILEKATQVRLLGQPFPVRARVTKINGFSAHADRKALGRWLDGFKTPPRRLFVTHGDADVARETGERIRQERGWTVEVPEYLEIWDLD
ncbi:MAG: MBL fold metallo-hydrolase [Candidatus Aminicenantes bacterium]|nr:MBL fold metallo-hydrolase [Candidatus Aminicenantes bacterium]MCJ7484945.1 MBL fold metallo-hydrolase [Candidatus Aminicenantes bacterium]